MTDSTGTTTYQYDYENRLIKTTKPDGDVVEYKYDPFGRRIEKNVNGTITRFVYDREDILFELDSSGNVLTEYLHGPGIDEPIAMIKGGQTYYYHADGLGSIIAITNFAGQVVQRYEYNSFGEITYQQDPNFIQPYTYTGREYDTKTGLYYYRARYYDAKVGRFITQDPIGFSGGINFYSYVGNNPVNRKDPLGLMNTPGGPGNPGGIGGVYPAGLECYKCDWKKIRECIALTYDPDQIGACSEVCKCPLPSCRVACAACLGGKSYEVFDCFYENCKKEKDECCTP